MVKEFSAKAGANLMVAWEEIDMKGTEKKLSRMCAMVLEAHGMKIEYGLALPGHTIYPDSGQAHRNRCGGWLFIRSR